MTREKVRTLAVNQTSDDELTKLFGEPQQSDEFSGENRASMISLYYQFNPGVIGPVAFVNYYWLATATVSGKLTGYIYLCNNGDDATRFEPAKTEEIVEGTTTRQELFALLGEPVGYALPDCELEDYKKATGSRAAELLAWGDAPRSPVYSGGPAPAFGYSSCRSAATAA